MDINVSEMTEAESVNDEDLIMIVQNGANKKATAKNVRKGRETVSSSLIVEVEISANADYAIPIIYIVGNNSLSIFIEGCKLINNENYIEVGEEGTKSTTIQFLDWDVPVGSKLEFLYK